MASPFSGPLAGHGDNSVPGTERSACSAASGEQMNNGKCLSDKAPGARARPGSRESQPYQGHFSHSEKKIF